jgi:DNA polymerase-4
MTAIASPILHVDMDAFYASVEQRDRPELRGRPVIVGGVGPRGVVSAASYEARRFGVHSAMPTATARRLCPQGDFLPPRGAYYAAIGRQIRQIFLTFTPLVEPLSLDEAFLDVRGCEGLFGSPPVIARAIKERVKRETGLTASVGVAPNKFLAKLAGDLGKPDGLSTVLPEQVTEFLAPLPVSRLWGVGARAEQRLHSLGIRTVGQLAERPERLLADHFGVVGRHLWQLAHGQDDRRVVPDRQAKSISTETTFDRDLADHDALRDCLLELVDELAGRLRQAGVRARAVTLKLRSSDFRTRTRACLLQPATHGTDELAQVATELLEQSLAERDIGSLLPLRLLGVGAGRLTREEIVQGELFDDAERERHAALDRAVDAIREQFGAGAIRRANRLARDDPA